MIRAPAALAMLASAFAVPALAEVSVLGLWQRDTGTARVQIAPCGDKLCGTIVWVRDKDSPTKVGMRVFYEMENERASVWSGKAFNPENGKSYEGTVTVVGSKMTSTGCVLGRLICTSIIWDRVR